MAERFVSTIYCDDVRHEVGPKQSWIGIYGTGLAIENFPATIPKLAIVVTINTPRSDPIKVLKLDVLAGENLIANAALEGATLEKAMKDALSQTEDNPDAWMAIRAIVEMTNVTFAAPVILRTRVTTETGTISGATLQVHQKKKK